MLMSELWMAHAQANMMLRPEQKTQLLGLRRTLLQTMATLLQERRMIQALIKASILSLLPLSSDLALRLSMSGKALLCSGLLQSRPVTTAVEGDCCAGLS